MKREKLTSAEEVHLKEPMLFHTEDGKLSPVKKLVNSKGFYVIEEEGECYVVLSLDVSNKEVGLLLPIKERFNDLEEVGSNTSEEGIRPAK